jgi:hypothetical protein
MAAQTAVVADEENQTVSFGRIADRGPTLRTVAAIAIGHCAILLLDRRLVKWGKMLNTDNPVRCEVKRSLLDAYDTETRPSPRAYRYSIRSWEPRQRISTKRYDAPSRWREFDQNRQG